MTKILLVRTSSMGDLVHTLPAVTDLARHFPHWRIDWLAEEAFAEIARLHPAVDKVWACAVRRWRKRLYMPAVWQEISHLRQQLATEHYQVVVDAQGLLKSAVLGRWAAGDVMVGFDRNSIREPVASYFYQKGYPVSRGLGAVLRNRMLLARAFGYQIDENKVDFGLAALQLPSVPELSTTPYCVALTATSRPSKEWPETHWLTLAESLYRQYGWRCVLPWGNEKERERAERLAQQMPAAFVPPRLSLTEAAALLSHAAFVVGVDTGLSHLANALDKPLVALYTDTDPAKTGVIPSLRARNLGGVGQLPTPHEVLAVVNEVMC